MPTVDLELYGYDPNTSLVFNYLLDHVGRLSAKEIMDALKLAPKACYAALKKLVDDGLVEAFEDEYPKLFSIHDPDFKLSDLTKDLIDQHQAQIRKIKTELDKAQTIYLNQCLQGSCNKEITFTYYRHNTPEAQEFLKNQFSTAKTEILVHLLPCHILKQENYLELLNEAANRDVWIGVYLRDQDLDIVPEFDDKIKVFYSDTSNDRYVSVDNRFYILTDVLVDSKRLISISYDPRGEDLIISSFISFQTVQSVKNFILSQKLQDARNIYNNTQETLKSDLLKCLKQNNNIPKQELAELLQISGRKLNELLGELEIVGLIKIQKNIRGQGRPQELVFVVGNETSD
ncbi:MAG: winged helix-turn-helix transcriptional regulator [Candidatus Hermodarchaeota archaeon]